MSKIEWTEKTWNPIGGCSIVSEGCRNCYAMRQAYRNEAMGLEKYKGTTKKTESGRIVWTGKIGFDEKALIEPLKRKKPTMYFVNSMSDLFHENVPFDFIDKVFDIIWQTPQHTYQILTKRPERMLKYVQTRSYRKNFGWTEPDQYPFCIGDYKHFDDIVMRNMCGYIGNGDWVCEHSENNECGEEKSCSQNSCPVYSTADSRKDLETIGVADQYEYDSDGYAEDCEWMKLYSRPKNAAPANLWLGFSAENQETYDKRARIFRMLRHELGPYFILFTSFEPLLGPIETKTTYWDKSQYDDSQDIKPSWGILDRNEYANGGQEPLKIPYINQIIVGGESGPNARPMHQDWVRSIRDQCVEADVPFFFKQWGRWKDGILPVGKTKAGRLLDGQVWDQMPIIKKSK